MQFNILQNIKRNDHNPWLQSKPDKSLEHSRQLVKPIRTQSNNFNRSHIPSFILSSQSIRLVDIDGCWGLDFKILECFRYETL